MCAAPTFPRPLPDNTSIQRVEWAGGSVVGRSASPWTLKQQKYVHPGQAWSGTVVMVPLDDERFAAWRGWGLSMNGIQNTFLMGDPSAQQQPITAFSGLPQVDGAGQTGKALNIKGGDASVTQWGKQGYYIQLGTGADARMFCLEQDADTDGLGDTTVYLWPNIRTAPSDSATVITTNVVGVFQFVKNSFKYRKDARTGEYDCTFEVVEAI